jgi:lysophospholipase L1-like esterase
MSRTIKAAFSALLAFCCALAFWEAAARVFILKMPETVKLPGGAPASSGHAVWSYDGFSRTFFSPEGFRSPYSLPPKGASILVIGDSFAAAQQVADHETFPSVAQQILQEKGITTTFYNKGIAGGAPPRYIAYSSNYLLNLDPNLVIVQLGERDFTADYPGNRGEFLTPWNGRQFSVEENPRFNKRLSIISGLPGSKQILSLSMTSIARRIVPVLLGLRKGRPFRRPAKGELPVRTEEYVHWTIKQLKQAYPEMIVVYVPQVDYFNPENPPPKLEDFIEAACAEHGVSLINAREDYLELLRTSGFISHGFANTIPGEGHINKHGHELIGRTLAGVLEERLVKK